MKRLSLLAAAIAVTLTACGGGGGGGGGGAAPPPPPANRAPTVSDLAAAVDPGIVLNGTLSGTDPDGDALTFTIGTMPASGGVVLSGTGGRDYEYTPNPGFVGADSFTFTASDGSLNSSEATVTINVNSKPVLSGASYSTNEDSVIDGTVVATDAEGDSLTYAIASQPTRGALNSFNPQNGDFRYNPDDSQDGADSFTVTASDAFQTSDPVTVNVTIYRWSGTQQYGSSSGDRSGRSGMIRDADGNIIVAGNTGGTIDGTPNQGFTDAFIRKFDRRGNEVWTRQTGDADLNYGLGVVAIPGSTDFYMLELTNFPPFFDVQELRVRRMDRDGIELWSSLVDLNGLDLSVTTVGDSAAVDANGDLYVLSAYDDNPAPSTIGNMYPVISKMSGADGSAVWRRITYEQAPAGPPVFPRGWRASGLAINQGGELIVVGSYTLLSGGPCNYCGLIAAFDSDDGSSLWVRSAVAPTDTCDDGSNVVLAGVVIAEDNGIVVTGTNSPGSSFTFEDGLIFKMNADATQEVWSYCDNSGDDNRSLFRARPINAQDGDVIAVGAWLRRDNVDFVSIFRLDPSGQLSRILIFLANDASGSPADFFAAGVVEDEQEYVYIHGHTEGQLPGTTALGDDDVYLLRLDPNFSLP